MDRSFDSSGKKNNPTKNVQAQKVATIRIVSWTPIASMTRKKKEDTNVFVPHTERFATAAPTPLFWIGKSSRETAQGNKAKLPLNTIM